MATWESMFKAAVSSGHPEPRKLADTMWRARERTIELKNARAHTQVIPFQVQKSLKR